MRRILNLQLALMVAIAAAFSSPALVHADDNNDSGNGSPQNQAIAINTTDGTSIFKLAFSIKQVMGDTVAPTNLAEAYSQCSHCRTIAIAIQVVIATNNPHTVTPQNAAVAVNYKCSMCDTFASAYQYVVTTNRPMTLTDDGREQIRAIERALQALNDPSLSLDYIRAQVKQLEAQLTEILRTQLVPVTEQGNHQDQQGQQGDGSTGATPQSPRPSPTASPSASPSARVTPAPTPTPSASPSP